MRRRRRRAALPPRPCEPACAHAVPSRRAREPAWHRCGVFDAMHLLRGERIRRQLPPSWDCDACTFAQEPGTERQGPRRGALRVPGAAWRRDRRVSTHPAVARIHPSSIARTPAGSNPSGVLGWPVQQGDSERAAAADREAARAAPSRSKTRPRWTCGRSGLEVSPGGREDEVSVCGATWQSCRPSCYPCRQERTTRWAGSFARGSGSCWDQRRRRTDDAFRRGTSTSA